jgi:hypothetical protein
MIAAVVQFLPGMLLTFHGFPFNVVKISQDNLD